MSWWWIVLAAVRPGPVDAVIATAKSYVGTPYVYGGASHEGVDCSGLVMIVYTSHGVSMPRTAADQARTGAVVPPRHVAPGDLLFFSHEPGTGRIEHVGVAVDAAHMIHASTSRHQVVVDSIASPYFQERLVLVRRPLPSPPRTRLASASKTAASAGTRPSTAGGGAAQRSGRASRGTVEAPAANPRPAARKAPARRSTAPRAETAVRASVAKAAKSASRHARCAPAKVGKAQGCLARSTRSASDRRK